MSNNIIQVSETAIKKIKEIVQEEQNNQHLKIRVFVQGGGCSGFQYGFTFDEDQNEDDFVYTFDGTGLLIDSMSAVYLSGAEIDYVEDASGSQFKIKNPNAESTCGCGSSFNPY